MESQAWTMKRGYHTKSFGVSNYHDMSRWFEKISRQLCDSVGDKLVLMEFGNEHDMTRQTDFGTSWTYHREKQVNLPTFLCRVAGKTWVCSGCHREVGVMEYGLYKASQTPHISTYCEYVVQQTFPDSNLIGSYLVKNSGAHNKFVGINIHKLTMNSAFQLHAVMLTWFGIRLSEFGSHNHNRPENVALLSEIFLIRGGPFLVASVRPNMVNVRYSALTTDPPQQIEITRSAMPIRRRWPPFLAQGPQRDTNLHCKCTDAVLS